MAVVPQTRDEVRNHRLDRGADDGESGDRVTPGHAVLMLEIASPSTGRTAHVDRFSVTASQKEDQSSTKEFLHTNHGLFVSNPLQGLDRQLAYIRLLVLERCSERRHGLLGFRADLAEGLNNQAANIDTL